MTLDYVAHLRAESARFAEALREAAPGTPVPTCPNWNADDLLWHLGEVQWFWASIVRDSLPDPSELKHPDRPSDRDALLAFFSEASDELQRTLATTDPTAQRWTWSKEQTAGFTRRRQAHESLIHRVDAELTAGLERRPIDPALAEDGVDEVLRIMYGGAPPWGTVHAQGGPELRVTASDTDRSWLVSRARFTGTDPDGTSYDEPSIVVADADLSSDTQAGPGSGEATLRGRAADLDCWLWGRPPLEELERDGSVETLSWFDGVVAEGID
jgi:uncharacterized protein (TIGR03083 family)